MVRLKERTTHDKHRNQQFQFQYGTSKSPKLVIGAVIFMMFQFQDGTIKSCFRKYRTVWPCLFQFQYGTIKSPAIIAPNAT